MSKRPGAQFARPSAFGDGCLPSTSGATTHFHAYQLGGCLAARPCFCLLQVATRFVHRRQFHTSKIFISTGLAGELCRPAVDLWRPHHRCCVLCSVWQTPWLLYCAPWHSRRLRQSHSRECISGFRFLRFSVQERIPQLFLPGSVLESRSGGIS